MYLENEEYRNIIPESILGFQFWSLFAGFFPMIWFYPLNELDVTGYEIFLGILLVPILCEIKIFLSAIKSRKGLMILRIISSASIASFQAPTTFARLVMISVGLAANILVLIATHSSDSAKQRFMVLWGLFIGYIASLVGRIWYFSVFPTWADFGTNGIVLAFSVLATVDRIFFYSYPIAPFEIVPSTRTNWMFSGLGFGSFLYVTSAIFGEVSVICRWVVHGYPYDGPIPNRDGFLVLTALVIGLDLSFDYKRLPHSKLWWFFGSCGMFVLYNFSAYIGFMGGLVAASYVMSIGPTLAHEVFLHPHGRSMTVAMITFLLEMLFSIWTIAYNFVPGGVYTREHTGYLLLIISFTWFISLFMNTKTVTNSDRLRPITDYFDGKKLGFYFCFLLFCFGFPRFLHKPQPNSIAGFIHTTQPMSYERKVEKINEISTLIWTYHFGFDNEGWPSLERAAKLLNKTGADIITLLESDASKPYLGNNDLAMWFGEKLQMYVDFGPSTRDHTWGNLILSKYPIVKSVHHLLPSPHGELAPAISATVNVFGRLINLVTSHMGNDRDSLDRQLQAQYLANLTATSKNPVVLLAYVTSAPGSRDYQELVTKGRLKDIDDTDRDRWCEYIMYRGLIRVGYARISHGGLSDTELQMAKFEIPELGSEDWVDNDKIEIDADKVPDEQKFNSRFGTYRVGHNWARTHQFHSSSPKYFVLE